MKYFSPEVLPLLLFGARLASAAPFGVKVDNRWAKHHHRMLAFRGGSSSSSSSSSSSARRASRHANFHGTSVISEEENLRRSSSPVATSESTIGRSNRKKWYTKSASSAEPSSSSNSISALASGRKACGFYLWDAPSALFYRWSNHLLKDCIYEGRGGTKFVRIEPGSMLQLLYPWSRYSPDRCVFCGGTFQDHVTLWWSKNLYTPFDSWLDKVRQDGVQTPTQAQEHLAKYIPNLKAGRSKKTTKAASLDATTQPPKPEYVFHRRYVFDFLEALVDGATSRNEKKKRISRAAADYPALRKSALSMRFEVLGNDRVLYVIPSTTTSNGRKTLRTSSTYRAIREIFLRAVDNLIFLELYEKQTDARKASSPRPLS